MTTTRPLQQNGHRAPGLAAALHYFISKLFSLHLPVCLAETTVSWWCSQNSCNYFFLEMAPKRRARTPSRAAPPYSATLPSQPPTAAPPGVSALDISSTITASITAAMQPVWDRLGRLEASPAISSTDDAAVSVPVQAPAHGKSSIFWSSISRTIVDKVVAGQYVEMASLLPLSPTSVTAQEHTFRLSMGTSGDVLVSQQPRSGRKIMDLTDWLEAWTNFAGIVGHSHPIARQNWSRTSTQSCKRLVCSTLWKLRNTTVYSALAQRWILRCAGIPYNQTCTQRHSTPRLAGRFAQRREAAETPLTPRRTTSVASSTAALASGRLVHTSTDALPAMVKTMEPSTAHPIVDPSGPHTHSLRPA